MKASLFFSLLLSLLPVLAGSSYAGSISGSVSFRDTLPGRKPIKVTKDQDYCGMTLPDDIYFVGADGAFENVIVFLERAPMSKTSSIQTERLLDNQGCRFAPRVLAMRLGERLTLRNSDPKLHIVHSYLRQRTVFNAALPFRGSKLDMTSKIRAPGLLQVSCDTHGWMRGYIYVFDHPFFAVTDRRGEFSIQGVPPGDYILKAWHEDAGVMAQQITVRQSGETRIDLEFKTPRPAPSWK